MSPQSTFAVVEAAPPKGARPNFLSALIATGIAGVGALTFLSIGSIAAIVTGAVLGLLLGASPQVAKQWERVVVQIGRAHV